MTNRSDKIMNNIDINKGSILLLFDEADAKITRNWPHSRKPTKATAKADRRSR